MFNDLPHEITDLVGGNDDANFGGMKAAGQMQSMASLQAQRPESQLKKEQSAKIINSNLLESAEPKSDKKYDRGSFHQSK